MGYWTGKQRQKEIADKIKFPYNLQPIDKYLKQEECYIQYIQYNILPATPYCLNSLLEGETTLAWQ